MKHSYSYLALLFFVMSGGLSAMDSPEIPTRREILENNMLARYPSHADREAAFAALEADRVARKKESNKEKRVKINWLSEFAGALAFALVVGVME